MTLKFYYLTIIGVLLSCIQSCAPINPSAAIVKKKNTKDAEATEKFVEPRIPALDSALRNAFIAHQNDDTFYYEDDTYPKAWGAIYAPYSCTIGHVFSQKYLSAVLFRGNDNESVFDVYRKTNGKWNKVFTGECSFGGIDFYDWNGDGIPDISSESGAPTDPGMMVSLWLSNKKGNTFHEVKKMNDLRFPQLDSVHHQILVDGMHNYAVWHDRYRFQNSNLVLVEKYEVQFAGMDGNPDSLADVTLLAPGRNLKKYHCTRQKAYDITPKKYKEDATIILGTTGLRLN